MLPPKLAIVDIETTGGSAIVDRIIEIGIIRVEDGVITETFKSFVDPQGLVPEFITTITGITNDDVQGAPTFGQLKYDILPLLDDCVFVAHNARFDYAFIKNECQRENLRFNPKQLCTVKLSRLLFPQHRHHNLDSLIERFNLECPARHRAYDDAHVLWQFLQKLPALFPQEELVRAMAILLQHPTLPKSLDQSQIDSLPEGPGVYIFYGEDGIPLYVGKSKNIKERVCSHFAADHSHGKEMQLSQQVVSIETIETAGELSALLKESSLVKELKPIYNKQLRDARQLVCLLKETMADGYDAVKISSTAFLDDNLRAQCLGITRSVRQAKTMLESLAQKHQLCKKLLGLEKAKGPCFGYRLGTCAGACTGQEHCLKHNMRFAQAFADTKLKSWPFPGPIAIVEGSPLSDKHETLIVDQWQIIGHKTSMDDVQDINLDHGSRSNFDVDSYKILANFLLKPQPGIHISTQPVIFR